MPFALDLLTRVLRKFARSSCIRIKTKPCKSLICRVLLTFDMLCSAPEGRRTHFI